MTAIVIVEDDVLANEHLEFILQQAGYEVFSATSADEAAELLDDHEDVQLLVTDINLPGTVDGLKLAAAAKARRDGRRKNKKDRRGPGHVWCV